MRDLINFSRQIRLRVLDLCSRKKTSHIGSAFSVAEILAVLYGRTLNISPNNLDDPNRDRFFYSKGHACTALYAALELKSFFEDVDVLKAFTENGTYFTAHVNHHLPGVELSTGSLGHALGVGCGTALAIRKKGYRSSVFVLLSDGELDEGSNWEAILFAAHHGLGNLTVIVDYNKIQSFGTVAEVMGLEPLAEKFRSFNWYVEEVDGHSVSALSDAFTRLESCQHHKPKCLIAHTIKGKGVSFMENKLAWHYKSPTVDEANLARIELGGKDA